MDNSVIVLRVTERLFSPYDGIAAQVRQQLASPSGLVVCVCVCFYRCVYVMGEGLGPVEVSGSWLC